MDSSVCPIRHDRGGIPDAPRQPYVHELASGSLWEFPPSVARIANVNLPISGGGYFRLYPYSVSNLLLQRVNTKDQLPFVFYIHPWEIDPDQPRLNVSTLSLRFRHYVNLSTTEAKLERLLGDFAFGRLDDVLNDYFVAGDFSKQMAHLPIASSQ